MVSVGEIVHTLVPPYIILVGQKTNLKHSVPNICIYISRNVCIYIPKK